MSVQFDWTQIKGIRTNFKQHVSTKYATHHETLYRYLSFDIDMPMIDIFQEKEITPESATLAPDFVKRIREAYANELFQHTYNNDIVHISHLFSESTVQYKDSRNCYKFLRTPSTFVKAAQQAINDVNSEDYIDLFFTIDHWHFDEEEWVPENFNLISLQEPHVVAAPAVAPTANPTTNTNQDYAAVLALIANNLELMQQHQLLIAQQLATGISHYNSFPPSSFVNPGVYPTTTETSLLNPHHSEGSPANRRNPERRVNQGVSNPIRTTNTGNPKSSNLENLPAPVQEQYEKNDNGNILDGNEMEPFVLPIPTLIEMEPSVLPIPTLTASDVITSSFVNPGVYPTTTETSLLNPHHSEGSLANKFTPSRVATSSLATSSLAFHSEPFADLLQQRIQDNNQSKSSTKDKNSLATFPTFCGAQSHLVRKWCQEVLNHCTRLSISLHPYYLSLKETDMENHIFDRDNPANNDVTVPVYSPLDKGPQDPIQIVKPLQRTDEDSPFPIVPAKLPTGICLYNSFPPSSFVNPGVYPTTTETSLLNPHNSEGSQANKLTPFRLATSSLAFSSLSFHIAFSSLSFHIELFATLLYQRIQVPTTNKAAKPTLIGVYVLSVSHNQVVSLASSTNAIRKCFDQGVYNKTHISAIKTKFAQLSCKVIAENQEEADFRMQVLKQLARSIIPQSSNEAEVIAARTAEKRVRYVRSILTELGFPQDELLLLHIPGTINPSDNLTKPLGYMLHNRNTHFIMNRYNHGSIKIKSLEQDES